MFAVDCPRHQRRVLLSTDDILSLTPVPGGGFVIGYCCYCGFEGQWPPSDCEEKCNERMAG